MTTDRAAGDELFANILGRKPALAIPLLGAGIAALRVIGCSHEEQATV